MTRRHKQYLASRSFRLDGETLANLFALSLEASRKEGKPVSKAEVIRRLINQKGKV